MSDVVDRHLIAATGQASRVGIAAWCTAHPETLARHPAPAYRDDDAPVLIEATCNQVNQDGGYTGMTPADFRRFVEGIAPAQGVDPAAGSFWAATISARTRGGT